MAGSTGLSRVGSDHEVVVDNEHPALVWAAAAKSMTVLILVLILP